MNKFRVKVGDHVAYSAAWLQSVGMLTGDIPHARGVVTKVQPLGDRQLVSIKWDKEDVPTKVMSCNLAIVGPNSRFCAC